MEDNLDADFSEAFAAPAPRELLSAATATTAMNAAAVGPPMQRTGADADGSPTTARGAGARSGVPEDVCSWLRKHKLAGCLATMQRLPLTRLVAMINDVWDRVFIGAVPTGTARRATTLQVYSYLQHTYGETVVREDAVTRGEASIIEAPADRTGRRQQMVHASVVPGVVCHCLNLPQSAFPIEAWDAVLQKLVPKVKKREYRVVKFVAARRRGQKRKGAPEESRQERRAQLDAMSKTQLVKLIEAQDAEIEERDDKIGSLTLKVQNLRRDVKTARTQRNDAKTMAREIEAASTCRSGDLGEVNAYVGYCFALNRNKMGNLGSKAAVRMMTCREGNTQVREGKVLLKFEHRASMAKRLRTREFFQVERAVLSAARTAPRAVPPEEPSLQELLEAQSPEQVSRRHAQ